MPKLIITVDPQCCRCITKLQNILCCIQDRGEFVIDKISYEKDKVHVSGPFDAERLYCKLWCKAGKIIKGIEVDKSDDDKKPKLCVCAVCVRGNAVCVRGIEVAKPDKPKPELCVCAACVRLQPTSTWPLCVCGCPTPNCETETAHIKPPPRPKPPTCVCPTWSSCHCCSYPPAPMPYPTLLVCEESPPYGACAVM